MDIERKEPDSVHIEPNPKVKDLRDTTIWPFWNRVLKLKNFKYSLRTTEIYRGKKGPHAKIKLHFKRDRDKAAFVVYISKSDPLYFTVAKGSNVFRSKACLTIEGFEGEFQSYFRRKRRILPDKSF